MKHKINDEIHSVGKIQHWQMLCIKFFLGTSMRITIRVLLINMINQIWLRAFNYTVWSDFPLYLFSLQNHKSFRYSWCILLSVVFLIRPVRVLDTNSASLHLHNTIDRSTKNCIQAFSIASLFSLRLKNQHREMYLKASPNHTVKICTNEIRPVKTEREKKCRYCI